MLVLLQACCWCCAYEHGLFLQKRILPSVLSGHARWLPLLPGARLPSNLARMLP